MRRSKGFTLVELLVVVGIIALLVTILMPTLTRARELAKQAICGANLNTIGKGIHIYLAEFDRFPLVADFGDCGELPSSSTTNDDIYDTSGNSNIGTGAMQNFWPIIKTGTSEKTFECPSDGGWQERKVSSGSLNKYGWIDNQNYSYGLHKPYDNDENTAGENKAPLTSQPQGNFVLMADKGNGMSVYWTSNADYNKPLNHKDDGFNCLTFQATVKFHKITVDTTAADSDAGISGDDIYVAGDDDGDTTIKTAQTAAANPSDDSDCFIVPWEE